MGRAPGGTASGCVDVVVTVAGATSRTPQTRRRGRASRAGVVDEQVFGPVGSAYGCRGGA